MLEVEVLYTSYALSLAASEPCACMKIFAWFLVSYDQMEKSDQREQDN
jgi:hypothetical protein